MRDVTKSVVDPSEKPHDGVTGGGPRENETRIIGLATHRIVTRTEGAADDHRDLWYDRVRDGVYHLRSRFDDASPFCIAAHHESVDVVKEDERDQVLIAIHVQRAKPSFTTQEVGLLQAHNGAVSVAGVSQSGGVRRVVHRLSNTILSFTGPQPPFAEKLGRHPRIAAKLRIVRQR